MKRRQLVLGFLLLFWTLLPSSGWAAGAVFFGDDESFGWCSDYGSREAARKCALEQCKQVGGVNCQLALECQGGWGAIATGDNGGYAIACEATLEVTARMRALLMCLVVDLYHVDGSDVFAQMKAMADKRARNEGGADQLDRKSTVTFTKKNGEKRVVDFGCVQRLGDRVSHGICYIEITKNIGLMTTVAPPSPNPDPGGVKTTEEGTAEMQRAFDLLAGMSLALLDVQLKKEEIGRKRAARALREALRTLADVHERDAAQQQTTN